MFVLVNDSSFMEVMTLLVSWRLSFHLITLIGRRVCSSRSDISEHHPVPQRYRSTCCFRVSGLLIVNDLPKGQLDVALVSNEMFWDSNCVVISVAPC